MCKAILLLLQPANLTLGAIVLIYSLIFWSVNKGVSIDEGYYLLGYLNDQQLGPNTSDFHRIVRAIFFFVPKDNALLLRWSQVILKFLLLNIFLNVAYRWIRIKYDSLINKPLFYTLGLLAGTMCFAYGSPVIYYDNIQLMIYLMIFSFFFLADSTGKLSIRLSWSMLVGFVLVFGLTNYLTSGTFLLLIVLILNIIYGLPDRKKIILSFVGIVAGIIIGSLVYSLYIYNVYDFFNDAFWAYESFTRSPRSKYDINGQLLVIGKYLIGILYVYIPLISLTIAYLFIINKYWTQRVLINIFFVTVLIVISIKYSVYFSNILLLPIVMILTDAILHTIRNRQKIYLSKNILFVLILIALPVMAVAGSNQRLEMKIIYFMPFWFLAYIISLAEAKSYINPKNIRAYHMAFLIVFVVVFGSQGFIKHIHYNYSIKRSVHRIEKAERFKNIGISEYQRDFYENGIKELEKAGFKPGDEVLAFYETFMLVYVAGGFVPHKLSYSVELFITDSHNIPSNKPNYIIINQHQINILRKFLDQTNWNFPSRYNQAELGTDGQNLTNLGYNYILFSAKQ